MNLHNPPHPGEFITEIYLEPNSISGRELAEKLGVASSTLSQEKETDLFFKACIENKSVPFSS
ncbi:transcriptional regulator [Pseudomonas sp. NFACC56-3]|uniref:helix-turn-helix transcriptional regulator n=1 Tax=unclassified Pseudomonas TaxID=196821 RepID=UPI000871A0CB|nr:hypothetical protein SAMN03159481_05761 [Pseudomonas sp. NFACC56-3]SFL10310.1 hypothetical protein SAMN03159473_05731 [Pseudomonas sp. NFACC52]